MINFSQDNLPCSKSILPAAASIIGSAVLHRSVYRDLIPDSIQNYFCNSLQSFSNRFSFQHIAVIREDDGLTTNQMYEAATIYLGSRLSPSTKRIRINKPVKEKELSVTVDKNQEVFDYYKGVKFTWVLMSERSEKISSTSKKSGTVTKSEVRFFELGFSKKHKDFVLKSYLPYILKRAEEIKQENKTLKLHTVDYSGTEYWSWTNLDHPATFDTMAMDESTKQELVEDLDTFIERKEFYRRVGKAWKRGYLLYGPPGTGKSSLVAAMANYLKFDVYDLDLREVQCNSDLRRLLIGTGNRSILVIEDIDCSAGLQNRESETEAQVGEDEKVTLSALLNFIDGLWSSCGDERILVFTTNHKDRLDPALLRPGRMDVHLHMSFCSFHGFKILASNYLGVQEHPLFEEIEHLIEKVQVTPAEVAGELMRKKDVEASFEGIIRFLQSKKMDLNQSKHVI